MPRRRPSPRPTARRDGLVVEELDDETLVYDLASQRAHCLNPAATLVWKASDGATDVTEMTRRLAQIGLPEREAVVWMALARLQRAGLLAERVGFPDDRALFTRKEVLRSLARTAGLALALPAVASITAPLAAQAASCVPLAQCQGSRPPNCGGLPICENRARCCVQQGRGRRARCRPRNC